MKRIIIIFSSSILVVLVSTVANLAMSYHEMRTGQRLWPWSAYASCGSSIPAPMPETVRLGFYEEFPTPERLARLQQLDFPIDLAVSTNTRAEFLELRATIERDYPQVQQIYWWPLIDFEKGYYPGTWSDADEVARVAEEAEDLPVLWDMEPPLRLLYGQMSVTELSFEDWQRNRELLTGWFAQREQRDEPVAIWRSHRSMGLNPPFLRLIGMHYDPQDYSAVQLHLDLYGAMAEEEFYRIVRCGVEEYGDQFAPALGSLDDGEGPQEVFLTPEQLRRNLQLARAAGVGEIWLFQASGINPTNLSIIRDTLPLASLAAPTPDSETVNE